MTNHGAFEQEYQVIYHCNYGPPLLGKGSRVLAAAKRIAPFNEHAGEGLKDWQTYAGPTKGFIEQVYCLEPLADHDGRGIVMLENAATDRAVTMRWNTDSLPLPDGLEEHGSDRRWLRDGSRTRNRLCLQSADRAASGPSAEASPARDARIRIDVGIHVGKERVAEQAAAVAKLQGPTPLTMSSTPPRPAEK